MKIELYQEKSIRTKLEKKIEEFERSPGMMSTMSMISTSMIDVPFSPFEKRTVELHDFNMKELKQKLLISTQCRDWTNVSTYNSSDLDRLIGVSRGQVPLTTYERAFDDFQKSRMNELTTTLYNNQDWELKVWEQHRYIVRCGNVGIVGNPPQQYLYVFNDVVVLGYASDAQKKFLLTGVIPMEVCGVSDVPDSPDRKNGIPSLDTFDTDSF